MIGASILPSDLHITLSDDTCACVRLRRHRRAKRLILRYDERSQDFVLTLPPGVALRSAQAFLDDRRAWMHACLRGRPPLIVEHGAKIPFLGRSYRLVFDPALGRTVHLIDGDMIVGGDIDLAPRRVTRFIQAEGRSRLVPLVRTCADQLGVTVPHIRFGDMRSRWGSCTSEGVVKLSWRLVMAPQAVQYYVAAHEVAHRLEMNHSARFWTHVAALVPDWKKHRAWLHREGATLQAVALPK